MIQNKTTQHFNYNAVEEIDPAKLPFDLKTPPKEIVHNIIFATNIYAYKFTNCIYCVKKEERSNCCGGKKVTAKCEKLGIDELVAAKCLFCEEYESNI